MQEITAVHKPLNCPRCSNAIVCSPGDIGSCKCTNVSVSRQEYEYISSKYSDCLCNNCIGILKQEFNATKNILRHARQPL